MIRRPDYSMIELKMSSPEAEPTMAKIAETILRWQDATQRFDEAIGHRLGLNAAERRCLALLSQGGQPPSVLAAGVGLTRSAMTALVDRLAARGLVARHPDPQDRRQVRVEATPRALAEVMALYRPLADGGAALLARRSPSELQTILAFVTEALALQQAAIAALDTGAGEPPRNSGTTTAGADLPPSTTE
jgi:DNA-binding MarR family transcriptional regulator